MARTLPDYEPYGTCTATSSPLLSLEVIRMTLEVTPFYILLEN
jgi:hypothetical protein